ncbi:DUF2971 domain-containing protein [Candidatus Bipolaricaulota bacterium]|nr:DUF2971 domain-containing protein [Candidatus Bipolaricaulota bacterium]
MDRTHGGRSGASRRISVVAEAPDSMVRDEEVSEINHPEVTVLYKYMGNRERALEILRTSRIWYSKPERFNDPFDCDIDIASTVTWEQYVGAIRAEGRQRGKDEGEIQKKIEEEESRCGRIAPSEYRDKVPSGVIAVKNILRSQGILSLSAVSDSIPMWGYYADCHSGVCIGFRRSSSNHLGSSATRKVSYTDDFPYISYYDMFERPGHLSTTVMSTKSLAWEHEQEWRVIVTNGDILHDLPGEVDCVLFGLRTPESFKLEVAKAIAGKEPIALRQAIKASRQFRIEFADYC